MNTTNSTNKNFPPLMKREVRNVMHRFHISKDFSYDLEEENKTLSDIQFLNVDTALAVTYIRLKNHKIGGSFNYATAVAHGIRKKGYNCGIITYEDPITKIRSFAVAYNYCGNLLVCDIIKYIQGISLLAKCSNIPFEDFQKSVNFNLCLFDLNTIKDSYIYEITSNKSNITPEEFMKLSYFLPKF